MNTKFVSTTFILLVLQVFTCSSTHVPKFGLSSFSSLPLRSSVKSPVQYAVRSPVQSPVQDVVQAPVQSPVQSPVQDVVQSPVQYPVKDVAQSPVKDVAQSPVQSPVQDVVQTPVQNPVQDVVQSPLQSQVQSPVALEQTPVAQDLVQTPVQSLVKSPVKSQPVAACFFCKKGKKSPKVITKTINDEGLMLQIDDINAKAMKKAAITSAVLSAPTVAVASKVSFLAGKLPGLMAAKGAIIGSMVATPIQKAAVIKSSLTSKAIAKLVSGPFAAYAGIKSIMAAKKFKHQLNSQNVHDVPNLSDSTNYSIKAE